MESRATAGIADQETAPVERSGPGQLLICDRRLDRPLGLLPLSHLSLVLAYSHSRDDGMSTKAPQHAPCRARMGRSSSAVAPGFEHEGLIIRG